MGKAVDWLKKEAAKRNVGKLGAIRAAETNKYVNAHDPDASRRNK